MNDETSRHAEQLSNLQARKDELDEQFKRSYEEQLSSLEARKRELNEQIRAIKEEERGKKLPRINWRRLRGEMAERMIPMAELSRRSGISKPWTAKIVREHERATPYVLERIARAVRELGIEGVVEGGEEEEGTPESGEGRQNETERRSA